MPDLKPTGTVTFLFTDIEGSTRLWEEQPEAMRETLAEHDRIVRSTVEGAGGYVFSTAGDAYAAAFALPASALRAAVEAQLSLAELAEGAAPVRVRMAIHTGSADERDGDYFGPALNRTARLLSAAHGGQVLASLATQELVQGSVADGLSLQDLGEHRLKDLSRPVRVFQVEGPGLPDRFPPLRSMDAFPHNLPIQLTSFVGREEEVEAVAGLLRQARMVTLAGVGGAGKTRLAVQTAAETLAEFGDGCWLVELAPLTDPSRIASTVASALGVQERPEEDPADTVTAWLRHRTLLLILDNCEHLIDASARFAERVLGIAPGVRLLATSREMLGVPGEHPYQVRSLEVPGDVEGLEEADLLAYPSVRLFVERAQLARPGFRIDADNAPAVVQIVNRLDGMPLAIELAVARLRMMSPGQIAERLDDAFRLLTGGSRTALPRQQTLEAAIDWSYDLLPDEEKTLFTRLAVFVGGFTLEAAEEVCGFEPLDARAILDLLGHLVDKSLVRVEERADQPRYGMLETLRQYARAKLGESGDTDLVRGRAAGYFRDLAEEAEPHMRSAEESRWFRRLDEELDNLRQAMGWAAEAGQGELAQATAGALYRYYLYRFRSGEGREWAERSLRVSDEPSVARAKALLAAGTLAQVSLDNTASLEHLDQAIELAKSLEADDLLGAALHNRANLTSSMGMFDEAARLWEEGLDLHRRLGSRDGEIISLIMLSTAALAEPDHQTAVTRAREAVELAKSLGSDRMRYDASDALLEALRDAGDLEEAAEVVEELRGMDERLGHELYPGRTSSGASLLAMDQGDLGRAATLMKEAIRGFVTLPEYDAVTGVVQALLCEAARLFSLVGSPALAARILGAADAVVEGAGFHRPPHTQREVEGIRRAIESAEEDFRLHYQSGKELGPREALDLLAEQLERYVETHDPDG